MKIQYIRLGFANNSSSTHSIVILDKPAVDNFNNSDYGWGPFLLTSKKEKARYFASQVNCVLRNFIGKATQVIAGNFFETETPSELFGIDPQSYFELPQIRGNSSPLDFIKDIGGRIIKDGRLAIFGGNNNGGDNEEYKELNFTFRHNYRVLARKEIDGTWILFDKINGHKIRLAPDLLANTINRKADTPELVDVKITDYCTANCNFCYQNSSAKGQHANLNNIEKIATALDKLNVFEVVLGGGEPTEHPNFFEIIKIFQAHNIIVNFTTKSTKWFDNIKICDLMQETIKGSRAVGSVAVSCTSLEETQKIIEAIKKSQKKYTFHMKADLQFIVGLPGVDLFGMIKEAQKNYFNISFVGYKQIGRAASPGEPVDEAKLLSKVKETYNFIKVDTAFLKRYPNFIQQKTCETKEGLNSVYIDAVAKIIRESSYTGVAQPVDFSSGTLAEEINNFFRNI